MKFIIVVLLSMNTVLLANPGFAESSSSIDSIQKMVDGIIEELSQALKRNKELTQEKEALRKEIEELTKTNQSSKGEIEKSKEKESAYSALQDSLSEYQARISEYENKIKELERAQGPEQNCRASLAQAENKIKELIRQRDAQKDLMFQSFYEIGRTFAKEKRYKEAAKNFEECVKLKPEDANVHYNLGVIYQYEYGDRIAAIYHLKKYLELEPKAKDRKDVEFLVELLER